MPGFFFLGRYLNVREHSFLFLFLHIYNNKKPSKVCIFVYSEITQMKKIILLIILLISSGFINAQSLVTVIAGNGISGYSGDGGPATDASIRGSQGVCMDSIGNLYIADEYNNRIRKVTFHPDCWPSEVPQISDKQLTLYPNPVLETLYIDNVRTNARYSLFNITGITITKGTLAGGSNVISLAGLAAGVYVVKIWDSDGVETVRRVVKW